MVNLPTVNVCGPMSSMKFLALQCLHSMYSFPSIHLMSMCSPAQVLPLARASPVLKRSFLQLRHFIITSILRVIKMKRDIPIERVACCPRCPPYSHSVLYSIGERTDVVSCDVHGEIPVSEVNEALLKEE